MGSPFDDNPWWFHAIIGIIVSCILVSVIPGLNQNLAYFIIITIAITALSCLIKIPNLLVLLVYEIIQFFSKIGSFFENKKFDNRRNAIKSESLDLTKAELLVKYPFLKQYWTKDRMIDEIIRQKVFFGWKSN
jgi:hypothetical protein